MFPSSNKARRLIEGLALAIGLFLLLLMFVAILLLSVNYRTEQPFPGTEPVSSQQADSESETTPPASESIAPVIKPEDSEPIETDPPEPQITYRDITLLSAGDIMFHNPQLRSAYNSATDTYSFTEMFQYLSRVVDRYDYAVANLETTFAGEAAGYTPNSRSSFNTPDSALDAILGAGFDMLLFANNHTYDRGINGIKRTVSFLEQNCVDVIGAVDEKDKPFHKIVNLGGTRIAMLNYTNDGTWKSSLTGGTINGTTLKDDHGDYISLFYLGALDAFYEKVENDIQQVKNDGADLVICYIHWGPEYEIEPRANTKAIAQKLCDLGVDAIIGSHPHVIQGAETLTSSTNPEHQTLCFYSLGNFISNQNRNSLSAEYCKGNNVNTENGLMVVLTIRKYSTGETLIVKVETIPTWVHRYNGSTEYVYRIIPLSLALADPAAYGLYDSENGLAWATEALAMTKELIDHSVTAFNEAVTLPPGTSSAISLE